MLVRALLKFSFFVSNIGFGMNKILLVLISLTLVSWNVQAQTQASGINFQSSGNGVNTSLRINWTSGTSTAGRIVIVKNTSGLFIPTNGANISTLNASNDFAAVGNDLDPSVGGVAKAVYAAAGPGSSVTVTNLTANTFYYVRIFEFTGSDTNPTYLLSTSATNPLGFNFYTSTGSFVVPSGVTSVVAQAWGGGAGGGEGGNGASGGGGGAYASGTVAVTFGVNPAVTIGSGGAAGDNNDPGANGGPSSFGAGVVAAGGSANNVGGVGAGGTIAASTGTVRVAGGDSGTGGTSADEAGGGGGSSASPAGAAVNGSNFSGASGGAGGNGPDGDGGDGGDNDSSPDAAAPGTFPGGGGGGRGDNGGTGGAGASGLVVASYSGSHGTLTPTGPLSALTTTYGTASSATTFTLVGSVLGANAPVLISAPAGFEVADGTLMVYGPTLSYAADGSGVLASKTVNVRLAASTIPGSYSGNVSINSPVASASIATVSSTVSQKNLTITGIGSSNKVYDRLNTATITGSPTLAGGIVGADVVNLTPSTPAATFASINVGTGITVTFSGYVLGGANASNYTLSQPPSVTADITAKNLTITGVVANNKPFDGTNTAAVDNSAAALNGIISPDVVTLNTGGVTATFASSAVGNGIVVTAIGYAIGGAAAGNYTVSQPTGLTANITALTSVVQVSGGVAGGPTVNTSSGTVALLGFSLNNTNNTSDLTSLTLTTTANPTALFSSISLVSSVNNTYDGADPTVSATLGTTPTSISFTGITGQTITSGGTFYYFLKVTLNTSLATADPQIKISFNPATSAITFTNGVVGSGSVINTINGGDTFYTIHDDIAPNVVSINRQSATNPWSSSNGTSAASVVFRIIFSENMQSGTLTSTDFSIPVTGSVAGATITGISPAVGTSAFDVTVGTYTGTGTLGLNYIDSESGGTGSVLDIGGNATITLPATPNGSFTGQTYSIVLPQPTNEAFTVTAPTITNNSIMLSWNSTNTPQAPTHFLVLAKQSAGAFPSVADGTPVVNGPLAQNVTRIPGTNTVTFNSLSSGTSYDFIVYKYTLSANNSSDNIDYETTAPGTLNGVITPTGTFSSIILNSAPVPISSLLDGNPVTEKANVLLFKIYDDGQDPISPNVMSLHLNGASQETVTFTLREELTLAEGASVTGFTSSTGTVASAIYSGKGTTNTITLTSLSNANWNAATTISYSPLAGNAQFLTLGPLQAINAHAIATTAPVVQTFTTSGSFLVPAGVTSIQVEAWGAGGSGGGFNNNSAFGSSDGGGGGAYSRSLMTVTPGASYNYTVGAGGGSVAPAPWASAFGVNGGASSFTGPTTVLAEGGWGGMPSFPNACCGPFYNQFGGWDPNNSRGGLASNGIGDFKLSGGSGGFGFVDNAIASVGGGGGSSAGTTIDGNDGANGFNCAGCTSSGGANPGGGGAGGSGAQSGGGGTGISPGGGGGGVGASFVSGAGAGGQIRITYSAPVGGGVSNWNADASPFKFNTLVVTQGAGNSPALSNWNDILAGAELNDGTNTVPGVINPSNITFSSIPASSGTDVGFVTDAAGSPSVKTYTLRVWLRNNIPSSLAASVDGLNLDFRVDPAGLTYDDVTNGFQVSSRLIPTQPAITSGSEQIQVVATQLDFSTNPNPTQFVQQPIASPSAAPDFSTSPVVRARDANGNTDLNFGGTVTLSSAITLSPSAATMTNGVVTFSAPQYQGAGNGLLTATTGGLTPGLSTAVTVSFSNTSTIIPGTLTTPATIASTSTGSLVQVFDFAVVDDGGSAGDGSPMRISQIVYTQGTGNDIGTWSDAIAQAQLFDGFNPPINGTIGTNTITFSGINTAGLGFVADNATKNYQLSIRLRSSMGGTLPDDVDNQNFVFEILDDNITLAALSSLFTGTAGITSGPSNIAVDVDATKLQFDTNPATNLLLAKNISSQPPVPVVEALDVNNNRDLNYNSSTVTTTNSLGLIMSNLPANNSIVNGLLTFPANFQFISGTGTGITLNVGATGPSAVANAVSTSFNVQPGVATTISSPSAPATISSLETNSGTPFTVFSFDVNDDPGGTPANNDDGLPTLLSSVVITANPVNNSITNWTQAIAGARLESGPAGINAFSISANSITFSGIPTTVGTLGYVTDNATKTYSLKIYLNTALGGSLPSTIDGLQFEFQVLQSNITLAANSTGIIAAQSATSGDNVVVDVDATTLRFLSPATSISASLDTDIPGILVEAIDANNNRDLDFTGASGTVRELTNTSGATMTNAPVVNTTQFASGLLSFASNFRYTSGTNGDDVTLTIKAGTGTNCGVNSICATSPTITLQSSFESSIFNDPTFSYPSTIPYVNFQESGDIQITGTSTEIARMLLVDGSRFLFNYGGFLLTTGTDNDGLLNSDQDGAATTLNSLTIRINNPSNLRRIALYNGTTEVGEIDVTAQAIDDLTPSFDFVFSGSPLTSAADNSIASLSIRASFRSTSPNLTDGETLEVKVVDAVTGNGSEFFSPSGSYIAGVDGGLQSPDGINRVNVIATKLDFVLQPSAFAGINRAVTVGSVEAHDQRGLLDTDFNSAAILSAAVPVNGSFAFASGVLDMSSMQYGSPGNGTITVSSGGLTSDVNNTVGGLPNVAVQCNQVDVLHVTTSYTNGGAGGVVTSPNLVGGTSNKVVFGFKFNAPYTVTGPNHPLVNKFRITFSQPTAGVFLNMRVFENNAGTVYSAGLPEVTTLGATYSQPTTNTLEVDFTGSPRDLQANPDLSYFLMVDIDINATGSTPQMTISVVDDNVDSSPTDNNILVSNGTSFSNTFGPDAFTFAATFPPSLISSYPAVGQSNVDPNQPKLELTFSVPVFTLDNQVRLHNKVSGVTTVLTAANGQFMGGAGTVAQPIIFNIPPGTLVANTEYYVTIAQGNRTNLTGIMDDSENLFPGISFSGTLFFKTSDFTPPKLLGPLTTPSSSTGPTVTNITSTGATLNATFDKKGRAYFMVLATNSAPPTNDQIKGIVPYVASPVISRGNFLVNSTNPVSQFGNIVPLSSTFAAGIHYVWMYAEAFVENDHVQTPIPTTDPYGASPTFAVAATGPTLTFVAPALTTGPITLNLPNINVCNNSYQILNSPIIISEGANNQFNASGTQTLNLVLPANFQFDVTQVAGVPQYGTLTLQGSDFVPGSGQLGFLGNSILTISYRNTNVLSRDKIIISGLRVIASASSTGPIFRLGGNALPSIIDSQVVATLSSFNAPFIEFDNSYSTNVWGRTQATAALAPSDPTKKVVTAIPDNTQPQTVELTPYVAAGSSDFGPSSFSGTGVNVNILNLSAATLDVPFNITITHTDQNGCVSNNAVQYLVYDHNAGVNITDMSDNADQGPYCSTNTNFAIDAITSPTYNAVIRKIDYDNLPSHLMETVTADIPTSADPPVGPPTQIINKTDFGGAWIPIIQGLPKLAPNLPPPNENPKIIGGTSYRSYTFDEAEILDANAISGGVIPDPYSNFRQVTPFQGNTYYTGGSLGLIEFTGTYRNSSNTTVQVPRRQLVEVFLPAVPIVEVGQGNQPVEGTPIYCQYGGPIAINGYPAALAGTSKGRFTLTDVSSGTVIYDVPPVGSSVIPPVIPPNLPGSAFVDNGNGTATLDPAQLTNGFQAIRITYTFQDDDSPCESSGFFDIQITPNPVADFATGLLCEDINVQFTDESTISNPGTFNIVGWQWDFGDPNSATNTSLIQNPTHLYDQPGAFPGVSLQARSDFGCLSTNPLNLAAPNTVEPTSKDLIVGGTPAVSFNFSGVSTAVDMTFHSTSTVFANSTITNVDWNFGDGTPIVPSANLIDVLHQYSTPGIYDVNAFATSGLGCTAELTQKIVMVDKFTPTDAVAYEEDFEADNGGWQLVAEPGFGGVVSWAWGAPSTSVITNPINGVNIWTTNLSGSYSPLERSYLYTTCFDMTQLLRPMISFNSMVQLAAADGVVVEYSTDVKNIADPTKVWTLLGDFNLSQSTGVDWYNALGLASKPGDQVSGDYGWSGSANDQWMESKHILDEINIPTPQANVVFRFGLASVNTLPTLNGFAMDNIRVGNRTRTIVVENFTNKANSRPGPGGETREKFESDNLKVFNPGGVGTKLVKINYHVGFPATDPFNLDNPADPSSRALYYNIAETPLARLDGFKNPDPQEAFFSDWGTEQYGIRTLQLAQAELTFSVSNSADGSLQVDVQVNPKIDLDANTRLHVAILEKNIPIGQLSPAQSAFITTGEADFEFVMKKMLPNALGTRFDQVAPAGQIRNFGPFNWYPEKARMYGPNDDIAVIVFLQNEDTREILQSEIMEDIADPPLVTGINRDINSIEHVAIYPNPADDEITVELPSPAANKMRLQIASQIGVIANEVVFEPGEQTKTIRTKDLAAGIYFLQLGNGQSATRKKVMIVHK